ncbi:MAG: alpha/beta fold hydrolase [Gammaproteobacteria bacterium]
MNIKLSSASELPLVFLPGWGFQATIWDELIQALKVKNALSINLPEEEKLDAIAERLNIQIPDQATLVGWSLGGLLATYFCYKFPKKCARLVLVSTTPKFIASDDWPGIAKTQALQFQKKAAENIEILMKNFLGIVQYPDRTLDLKSFLKKHLRPMPKAQQSLRNHLNLLFEVDCREHYQKLHIPVTHIFGDRDAIIPIALTQQFVLPADIKIIPNAGHVPFLTHQKIFLKYLRENL